METAATVTATGDLPRPQNKTVGIVGAGRIGAAYARMMVEGHKMNLVSVCASSAVDEASSGELACWEIPRSAGDVCTWAAPSSRDCLVSVMDHWWPDLQVYYDPYPNTKLEAYLKSYGELLKANGEEPVTVQRLETVEDVLRVSDVSGRPRRRQASASRACWIRRRAGAQR